MARLTKLVAENFCAFEKFSIPLGRQGLVFIAGDNRDSDSASSNGACKTGIFKALGWALYGKSIDKKAGDEVIRKGTKCARVKAILRDDEGAKYIVKRERRKQSPKLFVTKDGEGVTGSKADLQKLIDRLMGVDWSGFKNTVMYGQRDRDRFVDEATTDAERKRILHRILRTGVFELCYGVVKDRRLALQAERKELEGKITALTDRIDDIELDEMKTRVDGFKKEMATKAARLTAQARELMEEHKVALEGVDTTDLERRKTAEDESLERAQDGERAARGAIKQHAATVAAAIRRVDQMKAERDAAIASLELLDGDQCPTCEGSLTEGHGKAHRKALEARKRTLKCQLTQARNARDAAKERAQELESKADGFEVAVSKHQEAIEGLDSELGSAATVKGGAAEILASARAKAVEAKRLRGQENPHVDAYDKALVKATDLKKRRKTAKKKLKATDAMMAGLEFWARGYGPSGLPSFALDAVMPYMTKRANEYLHVLSDGDMSISFDTQRELKSARDEFRDEIGITWSIEGVEDYPPSGGQWKKMEVATNFAMMDLVSTREGSHVNILCLDECLDGMDNVGRQRVVMLLHKLRNERESIFVISHDTGLAEIFEKTITVVKEDGVSRLAA